VRGVLSWALTVVEAAPAPQPWHLLTDHRPPYDGRHWHGKVGKVGKVPRYLRYLGYYNKADINSIEGI
jgi:hypothetical protein